MRKTLAVALVVSAGSAFAASTITGIEFVTGFREMQGQPVTISDCRIGGTSADFVRCETDNQSASYALRAATMKRNDLKWAYEICPTGSVKKPACRVTIKGMVEKGTTPWIENAEILR